LSAGESHRLPPNILPTASVLCSELVGERAWPWSPYEKVSASETITDEERALVDILATSPEREVKRGSFELDDEEEQAIALFRFAVAALESYGYRIVGGACDADYDITRALARLAFDETGAQAKAGAFLVGVPFDDI
ncbi:MAG: hypothetical protein BZ138_06240, partial [Methanosphaera sp. rholeuAM270]